MGKNWKLELISSEKGVTLNLHGKEGTIVELISSVESLDDFEKELTALRSELDKMLNKAKSLFEAMSSGKPLDPQEIWNIMKQMSLPDMRDYFNSLDESVRREVANFIFSTVNMFSGAGPMFATFYDPETALLLEE
ncbi:MAG TPA: hypothetical protein ENG14_05395 [Thermodesulforhabdus norvegica]|uniref:Uncharacterized protein n=1 Tax=Thermodesulforhabdus norvegica TaxID=39841 RepID=A0A7C1B134_9BACT|nr:hypothetical protein [Deltaproteobacteria bacterium]MBW2069223.1 hypothetical protein [Deltaproteobacteria bacterium]HDL90320.1 hypothetical protein [Thermodesulforhabdus norvegica]